MKTISLWSVVLLSLSLAGHVQAQSKLTSGGAAPDLATASPAAAPPKTTLAPSTDPSFRERVENLRKVARGIKRLCPTAEKASELKKAPNGDDRKFETELRRLEELNLKKELQSLEAKRRSEVPKKPAAAQDKAEEAKLKAADEKINKDADEIKAAPTTLPELAQICPVFGPSGKIDLTVFTNKSLAAAAVAADSEAVDDVRAALEEPLAKLDLLMASKLADFSDENALGEIFAGVKPDKAGLPLAIGSASQVVDLASLGLAGLARLIVDRARYEAVGWFLETLGENLCATDPKDDAAKKKLANEMKGHFAPSLCKLAEDKKLWEYGAGTALWQSLQNAAMSDLKGLPGATAGLATLGLLKDSHTWLGCDPADADGKCKHANALRKVTATRVGELLRGEKPTATLAAWSSDLVSQRNDLKGLVTNEVLFDGVTCAASVPDFVEHWAKSMKDAGLDEAGAALGVGALVKLGRPGGTCEQLVAHTGAVIKPKERFLRDSLADALKTTGLKAAGQADVDVELLTAVVALANTDVYKKSAELSASLERFRTAVEHFEAAADPNRQKPASTGPATVLQISGDSDPKVVAQLAELVSGGSGGSDALERADAVLNLAASSRDLALPTRELLHAVNGNLDVDQARERLQQLRNAVAVARAAVKGNWAEVVSQVLQLVPTLGIDFDIKDVKTLVASTTTKGKFALHLGARSKDFATLVAIASAKNADDMAKALDALADPPGGWRSKRRKDQDTVSLTSHAGFYGAVEARFGTYGVKKERGSIYGQPPTLTLPVGIEYARGIDVCGPSSFNLLFTVIDPAAFLGYDVSNDGRIPGPSLLTALSPGLAASFGLGNSPFNLGPFFMFRPGYRQLDPDPVGVGAHALQVGALLSVDVTLFTLYSRGDQ